MRYDFKKGADMKFLHSMIRTNKEKEMTDFYCNLLGLKTGKRIRLEDCYLQYLTDETTGFEIEFTINDEKNEYINGNQFGHFAFECNDLDVIDKKLKEIGYSWYVEPFFMDEVNTRISFLKDPDGNEIELIENKN